MDSIKIEDYLQNRQPNKTGTCKQCGKQIPWNRQKLGNHKRSGNCLGQSKQEQNMFKSLNTNSTIFIGNQPESTFTESNPKRHKPNWIDSTTEEQKKHYDQKCARFIFENCLPFSVVESPSFKDFVKSIRPSYNPPTRKKVAGPLLLDEYEELKTSVKEKIEKARYVNLVSDGWSKAIELRDVLGTPTSLIGKFEKNDCRLSEIYNSFRELEKLQNSNDFFKKCVRDRWNFLHTESMGWSYLLNPSTEGGSGMVGNDRRETITQLKKFITVFFDIEEEKVLCTRELNTYLTNFEFSQKEADIEDPLTWWSIYGKEEFPNLSKIAIRVQQVPTSSAASERAWSIFARIHNKIGNRLMNERVHQLAYVCINKQLRSNYDVNNDNFDF